MATTPNTTLNTPKAFHPDVTGFLPQDVIPSALVLSAAVQAGVVEGDEPSLYVPMVTGVSAPGFVPEGEIIPETDATLGQVIVHTGKIAARDTFSREMTLQPGGIEQIVNGMTSAVVRSADQAFLNNDPTKTGGGSTGILKGLTPIGTVGANVSSTDLAIDAMSQVETDGGTPSMILAAPDAWAALLKATTPTFERPVDGFERSLYGLPVVVNSAMPSKSILVLDKTAVVSAVGSLLVSRSTEAAFDRDAVMVRLTMRQRF